MQSKCNNAICKEIEEMRAELKTYRTESEAKRDEAKEKLADQLGQIRIFMARIDQKIQDDRWGDNGNGGMLNDI